MASTNVYAAFSAGRNANPQGIAVRLADGRSLTYAELEDRSARVAAYLRAQAGVVSRVGICLADPLDSYAAVLAASRTGASFVPLDRDAPVAWRAHMVEVSAPDLVLADQDDVELGTHLERGGVPVVDVARAVASAAPDAAVDGAGAPATEAYVLFTSGSTGRPKGVPVTCANLAAFVAAITPLYSLGPADTVVQLHKLTFDMAVMEMIVAWGSGAVLDVPGPWEFVALHRYVRRRRPTWLLMTPSLADALRAGGRVVPEEWRSLRYLLFGGEALDAGSVRYWREVLPGTVIDNYYGPTELTIAASMWRNAPGDPVPELAEGRYPMGHVFLGLRARVEDLGTRADGPSGELLIAGAQVFPGYLGRSAPGTFVERAGLRYYATGDVVELHPDHGLVYSGRTDGQVKLRGHRVDLNAVGSVVARLDGVRDARLLLEAEGPTQRLVALVTGSTSAGEVQDRLHALLPRYMTPDETHVVRAFEINPNGKADLQATLAAARRDALAK